MSNSKHKTGRKPLKLGTVENYHHHWYLLIWLVYLTLFAIAEHVVTDNYWVSYLPLDDKIPFCRYFIIPYCLWHPLLFLMTLYLMFYDAEGLKRYMLYIGLGFGGSILFCLIFPNGQDLRPTEFAQHDLFTWLVQRIYAADTNTNVLPRRCRSPASTPGRCAGGTCSGSCCRWASSSACRRCSSSSIPSLTFLSPFRCA